MESKTELLEVGDEYDRQRRVESMIEKLSTKTTSQEPVRGFDFGSRTTYPMEPNSELLARVKSFIPQLEASNALLAQKARTDPNSVDIEHIEPGAQSYIKMDLGLGVFEQRSTENKDCDMDSRSSSSSSESDSDSDSGDDTDSSSEIITSFIPTRRIKPLPRRSLQRPEIVVISSSNAI